MTPKNFGSRRIIGVDLARALALFGMIIVNFKLVFGAEGTPLIQAFASFFEGKAAATFVVLAGTGLALTTKNAIETNNTATLKTLRIGIVKRALLLFVIGMSYRTLWPADILHFYGAYMLVTLFVLESRQRVLLLVGFVLILIYPLLMIFQDYETGWNFNTLTYQDFWTVQGFTRNLFYNGFHPVIPWAAFMIFGYWLGRQDLRNVAFVKRLLLYSLLIFIGMQFVSFFLIDSFGNGNPELTKELTELFGTSPMPPLPIYMFNGTAFAFMTISACILISQKFRNHKVLTALGKTGRLSLTFYVAHVIVGMGIFDGAHSNKFGLYSVEFSVGYAIVFSTLCVCFAVVWSKFRKNGPLEAVFRWLTK